MEEEKLSEEKRKSVFNKKEIWISGVVGLIIGALLIYLLGIIGVPGLTKGNKSVITTKFGKITENDIYNNVEKQYLLEYALNLADEKILNKKYTLTEKQSKEISEYIDSQIEKYGSEENLLDAAGYENMQDIIDLMTLGYKKNLCYIDYLKTIIDSEEINDYYNNNVYGEIDTKHMLVEITDTVTDEQALALAKEIIAKLDSGTSFDDVATEYNDKITFQELGYVGFNSGFAKEYMEASKALENGTYSKEPVKTSFGYHIIYRIDQKDKPSLEDAENDIVLVLGENLGENNYYYEALIKMREEYGFKFKDAKFEKIYKDYYAVTE